MNRIADYGLRICELGIANFGIGTRETRDASRANINKTAA